MSTIGIFVGVFITLHTARDSNVILTNYPRNFPSLEAVDRGSETQLQVTENLNLIAPSSKG